MTDRGCQVLVRLHFTAPTVVKVLRVGQKLASYPCKAMLGRRGRNAGAPP